MSNNAPDYDNLAFAPTSADELNEQGRQSEVLIKAIEKCERLEKQLNKAEDILHELSHGHQSRNAYNNLISMARIYFEELDK